MKTLYEIGIVYFGYDGGDIFILLFFTSFFVLLLVYCRIKLITSIEELIRYKSIEELKD